VHYPLQVGAFSVVRDAYTVYAAPGQYYTPGWELLRVLAHFRDFDLLMLAMAAMPLVPVAVWHSRVARGVAVWLSIWAALVQVETGFLLYALTELLYPHPTFPQSIGPGAVLVPLGAVLVVARVVGYWLQLHRQDYPDTATPGGCSSTPELRTVDMSIGTTA
jgi:hypothetical protein